MHRDAVRALLSLLLLAAGSAQAQLLERAMVPPEPPAARATAVNAAWVEVYLPGIAYSARVAETGLYTLRSSDDPHYLRPVHPVVVQHRHWAENAWYAPAPGNTDIARLNVVYRVYLRFPVAFAPGKTYALTVDPAAVPGGPALWFPFEDPRPNEALHVNQVAYLANGPKVAYLSAWTGGGSIDFGAGPFYLVDEATGARVFRGTVRLDAAAASEPWSGSNVYSLDFSSVRKEGRYHLQVPGIGISYSFGIQANAFSRIGYTLVRGLTLMRDGKHGLDNPAVTHWTRPSAHLDDAIDERTGVHVDLVGGHMDAGDRGKYPYHSADLSAALLSAMILFPDRVVALGDRLQLPESGNGVPDLLDETAWELDFLVKAVTAARGGLPFYLRAQGANGAGGYEQGVAPEGKPNRKFYDASMGPERAETLYAAGALAMAANNPLFRRYLPVKAAGYRAAAQAAFDAWEAHRADPAYWADTGWYDEWREGAHPWSDELLVAAAALLEMTGDRKYRDALLAELPADLTAVKHWGFRSDGPWMVAFLLLSRSTSPLVSQELKDRAKAAIVDWAQATQGLPGQPYARPFGMALPAANFQRVGWWFSGAETAFPLMLAYGVTGEQHYRDDLLRTWSYLLGGNPLSRTFVSGLGYPQRSPRWQVNEIAQFQWMRYRSDPATGWSELPPGIPSADLQQGDLPAYFGDAWNQPRRGDQAPANYPALYRYRDCWNTTDEFTVDRQARAAASIVPLITTAP